MTNSDIKQRAKAIIKDNLKTISLVAIIYTAINSVASNLLTGFRGSILRSFVGALVSASSRCFYLRTYNKGRADATDTYELFTYRDVQSKLFNLMFVYWIVSCILSIIMGLVAAIPVLNLVIMLVCGFIWMFMSIIYDLFVLNTEYSAGRYLKASVKYMGENFIDYLGFSIYVNIIPCIIAGLIGGVLTVFFGTFGSIVASLLTAPIMAYTYIARAGFILKIVPDEWIAGYAPF